MPITVRWDNSEHTVIFQQYTESWSWEEYEIGVEKLMALAASVPHPVDMRVNMSTFYVRKDFLRHLDLISYTLGQMRPHFRYVVLHEVGNLMTAIIRMFKTVYLREGRLLVIVETEDEAKAYIQDLPDVKTVPQST